MRWARRDAVDQEFLSAPGSLAGGAVAPSPARATARSDVPKAQSPTSTFA